MASITFATEGSVAIVTIERPEVRNAVDRPTAAELVEAFRRFDSDPGLGAAVLTGAGGNFCAGADLKGVAEGRGNQVTEDGEGPMGPTRMRLDKPVIAAVEGYAVAGGLELALWCDLRVAAEGAVFGVFCRRWGVPLVDGGTIRLPRLIGQGRALDMILTGRPVTAEEALAIGLANRVVPRGEARRAAATASPPMSSGTSIWPTRCGMRPGGVWRSSHRARRRPELPDSQPAPAVTAPLTPSRYPTWRSCPAQ